MFQNEITRLLKIEKPIIQAGMIWASGWRLASAVSNAGALARDNLEDIHCKEVGDIDLAGVIGAGSMYPQVLRQHISRCKLALKSPDTSYGVNIPLLMPQIDEYMQIIIEERVPIVFTSAGKPPSLWMNELKNHGITVVHVVSSSKFAVKAQEAGCDAVVAEGFEAGGHNGREETTTLVLVPAVRRAVGIPVIAAGGIHSGRSMLAAMVLGADGVQVGTRFVASHEASCHALFKEAVVNSTEGDTQLVLKQLTPVRLLKNEFYREVVQAEQRGASVDELKQLLGRARAKLGMFEGDLRHGELEIGQVSGLLDAVVPAKAIVEDMWAEFLHGLHQPIPGSTSMV